MLVTPVPFLPSDDIYSLHRIDLNVIVLYLPATSSHYCKAHIRMLILYASTDNLGSMFVSQQDPYIGQSDVSYKCYRFTRKFNSLTENSVYTLLWWDRTEQSSKYLSPKIWFFFTITSLPGSLTHRGLLNSSTRLWYLILCTCLQDCDQPDTAINTVFPLPIRMHPTKAYQVSMLTHRQPLPLTIFTSRGPLSTVYLRIEF